MTKITKSYTAVSKPQSFASSQRFMNNKDLFAQAKHLLHKFKQINNQNSNDFQAETSISITDMTIVKYSNCTPSNHQIKQKKVRSIWNEEIERKPIKILGINYVPISKTQLNPKERHT